MDMAGSKAVAEITFADVIEDSLRRAYLDRFACPINPAGMTFEIDGKGERLEQGSLRNRADVSLAEIVVGEVIDECQCRYEFPKLGNVPLKRRRQLPASDSCLKLGSIGDKFG